MSAPVASVVVALNPHAGDLREVIAAYAAQRSNSPRFELIVVDNGSRTDAAQQWRDAARVHGSLELRPIACTRPGRAAANNAGVAAARGDLLVFVADDFIPAPGLVRAHVDFHRHAAAPAVGIGPAYFTAPLRDDRFRRWLERSGRLFGVPFATAALTWSRDFFYAGNASLPRACFEALRGFDESFEHDLVDDLEFGLRLRATGVRTHLVHKAIAWHDHAVTLDEREVAMRRSGAAARSIEARLRPPLPWSELVATPVGALRERLAHASAAAVDGQDEAYFAARLDLAFVEGYAAA